MKAKTKEAQDKLQEKVVGLIFGMVDTYNAMANAQPKELDTLFNDTSALIIKVVKSNVLKSIKSQTVAKVVAVATKEPKVKKELLYTRLYIGDTKKNKKGARFDITLKSLENQLSTKVLKVKDTIVSYAQVLDILNSGKEFTCESNKSKYSLIKGVDTNE